jgi:phage protein D
MTAAAPTHQRAFCKITVAGEDVTSNINPRLLNLTVILKSEDVSEAHLELDDRYGQIKIPEEEDTITIELGWLDEGSFSVFRGSVFDLESAGQKRGGRTMTIIAHEANMLAPFKAQTRWSEGDGTEDVKLEKALKTASGFASIDVKIAPELAKLTRKFWMGNNESFMSFGQRIAGEVGGVFKMSGQTATITKPGGDADGNATGSVTAQAGKNLIAWRVRPRIARAIWANTGHVHFDPMAAAWKLVQSKVKNAGLVRPQADHTGVGAKSDKDTAQQGADGDAVSARLNAGTGWVMMNGEPQAQPWGQLVVLGARPGVDGSYTITDVEHNYNAQTGFTTRCDFLNPSS